MTTNDNQNDQHHHHHGIHFTLNGERYVSNDVRVTPDHILHQYGHKNPEHNVLVKVEPNGGRISFAGKGEEPIELHNGDQFESVHHHHHDHVIHFELDAEKLTTTQRVHTPDEILRDFGHKDPAGYYLVEVKEDGERRSFQGKGEDKIEIHDGENFITVKVGPTPVSDVPPPGIDVFAAGLAALGYAVQIVDRNAGRLQFAYVVEVGKYAGKAVTIGFDVPKDFPLTTPSGPHVSPLIHGAKSIGQTHPTSNIQASNFPGTFEYWSRPYPNWQQETSKTVATYMAYIRQLWATQ